MLEASFTGTSCDVLLVKNGSHRRDILMTEPQIDASETSVAGERNGLATHA